MLLQWQWPFTQEWLQNPVVQYGLKIVVALLILVVGLWLSKFLSKLTIRGLERSGVDPTLHSFIRSFVSITTKIIVGIMVGTHLGINMTTIIAALGAAAAAIALALKDSLSNIASGILILFSRPFAVGDFVEIDGDSGSIEDIQLFYTTIATIDNQRVIIPNSRMTTQKMKNCSAQPTRRLILPLSIGYHNDISHARSVLLDLVKEHPLALSDPEPVVFVSKHDSSAVSLSLRVWTKTEDYWTLHFDLLEQVKERFDSEDISIPYEQLDVHLVEKK